MPRRRCAAAWPRYYRDMDKLTVNELRVMVENALAKRIVRGQALNAVQRAVLVRLANAAAIEDSLRALRAAEVAS